MHLFQLVVRVVSAGMISKVELLDEATPEIKLYSPLPKTITVAVGDDLVCMIDSELRIISCEVFRQGEKIDPK